MEVGKYTYGAEKLQVRWENNQANLKIGKFCSLASNITVYLGGGHKTDWATTYPFGTINKGVFTTFNVDNHGHPQTRGSVIIGNDVWIGDNVTIMSGVRIGNGAVIAANSHVVSRVKPYTIVGGNPAQLYYNRFSSEITKKMLEIKWWDWNESQINEALPLLCSKKFDELFAFYEKIKK